MRINLLLNPANHSWIIQKIAENLATGLRSMAIDVSITEDIDEGADLVHHMSWIFARLSTRQPSTMFITHLDDIYKISQVRKTLIDNVEVGICMSRDSMELLVAHGCPPQSLHYINPAHDGLVKPRRTVIGITSRVYPDGRKREDLLRNVAQRMDLSAFEFRIFGQGWEPTIVQLERAGARVQYFNETGDYRKDYGAIVAAIPFFDYYLYLGLDEGSLGTLDALAAGVATIITPQGFHLDLPGGITHPVVSADDLERVLGEISAPRQMRTKAVATLTWQAYAEQHVQLWNAVLGLGQMPRHPIVPNPPDAGMQSVERVRSELLRANALRPRRLLSAISHQPAFRSIRRMIDRMRLGE